MPIGSAIVSRILDACILRPSRHALELGDQQRRWVSIDSGTPALPPIARSRSPGRLESFVHRQSDSGESVEPVDVLLLKFPGTAGRGERSTPFPANRLAARVDSAGIAAAIDPTRENRPRIEVWTWNPPGYGGSSGSARLATLAPAGVAWVQSVVLARGHARTVVWLCGNSLGCLPAIAAANSVERSRLGLWLRNPPDLMRIVPAIAGRYRAGWLMRRWMEQLPGDLRVIDQVAQCRCPAVYLTSELDSLVPPAMQATIRDAHAGPTRSVVLAALDHDGLLTDEHQPSIDAAVDWLWRKTRDD